MAQTNILLESGTNELELVEFFIDERNPAGGEAYRGFYGVNVAKVLEIIRMPPVVTQLPGKYHPSLLGAFNLRSKIIPLVNLAVWLGKEMVTDPAETKVIVSEFNRTTSAFMVSGVNRIHRISWEDVEPPGAQVSSFTSDSITGVVRFEGRILLILDMEKILGDLNPGLTMRLEKDELPAVPEKEQYKAIVADDSSSIRRMISSLLEKAGFEVRQTINGKEAWDTLTEFKQKAAAENRPVTDFVDIVISDIEMPAMDGHNLTKRIKDDPALKAIPVVLFYSLITDRLRHKGAAVGADDQISKPNIAALTARAFDLIRARAGA